MGNMAVVFPEEIHSYTASASNAENPSYPVVNVKSVERPLREFRTQNSIVSGAINADLGTAKNVAAVVLLNTNATQFSADTSPDGITYTTRGTLNPLNPSPWHARRHGIVSFAPVSVRYARAVWTVNAVARAGGMAVCSALNVFDQNMSGLAREVVDPRTDVQYLGGGGEGNSEGEPFLRISINKEYWHRAQGNTLGLLQRLARVRPNQSVIWYENNGDASEVYVCRVLQRGAFRLTSHVTVGHELVLEERV